MIISTCGHGLISVFLRQEFHLNMSKVAGKKVSLSKLGVSKSEVVRDYRIAWQSRQASLIGRKEVLTGKAKFGIFGDGKEVAQIAMAHAFRKGDIRSGYYRDQTFTFATGMSNIKEFFAQIYANADVNAEPASAGRSMNGHFASRTLNEDGTWKDLTEMPVNSADVSPTASQMPRLVGLAYASVLYRELEELKNWAESGNFSNEGNEVAFGTIGNASCAEGMFWEAINAIGVLKAPAVVSIWDDGYGISVPNHLQVTKDNVGSLLQGFQREGKSKSGYDVYTVRGWDYANLLKTYRKAAENARKDHVPAIIHVTEVTQPQGHSTSGSHERYKNKKRLAWEEEFDPISKMREWILKNDIATEDELAEIENEDKKLVRKLQKEAWAEYFNPITEKVAEADAIFAEIEQVSENAAAVSKARAALKAIREPYYRDIMVEIRNVLIAVRNENHESIDKLKSWKRDMHEEKRDDYNSWLFAETDMSALKVEEVKPEYSDDSPMLNGFEIINKYFDYTLENDPRFVAFGEDVGHIGDVNQGFAGMQEKYGEFRVSDTGIRECTIVGQAIGLAMRGLKPVAEVQYLDYLLYALQIMSDDLATVSYRTKGGQKAPAIVRTRGHRLEGIWHSGSHMGAIVHLLRGMHVCVPRNFVQAAGMYNTLMKSDDPGLVVEVLNGYRLKEQLPDNMGEYTVPLGIPELLREGNDVTVVTYGPNCRYAVEAADLLSDLGIEVEVIDVQTLLPFDRHHDILKSLKKTNRIVFLDEDVPGGASSYMMREVLEKQGGYYWLDSEPRTLTSKAHRPAYGSDGDYWSKPSVEDIFETVYEIMNEADPGRYPIFY